RTQGAAEYADWLAGQLSEGAVVAFDGKLASVSLAHTVIEKLTPLSIVVKANVDLLDPLWVDRPILPKERAYLIDEKTAGRSTLEKLQQLRRQMSDENIDAHFISSLDDL